MFGTKISYPATFYMFVVVAGVLLYILVSAGLEILEEFHLSTPADSYELLNIVGGTLLGVGLVLGAPITVYEFFYYDE